VTVKAVIPAAQLEESNRGLYALVTDAHHVVITDETIFHPQGGGQPSDEGTMRDDSKTTTFEVEMVRMDVVNSGRVLHFGRFIAAEAETATLFEVGQKVTQAIDVVKRDNYSKYHTAGHVLGSAVRHLLEKQVPGFDELKANHVPGAAACEFQGLIDGKWKPEIQAKLDEYIAANMLVEIDWWDEDDFKREGLERLIPDKSATGAAPGEKLRVVKIVGAEVYPCGGTHVDHTGLCGNTTVKKISRQKGNSRVSYALASSA
jgi:Ser-tRNA(Ala) deacylase AlaX